MSVTIDGPRLAPMLMGGGGAMMGLAGAAFAPGMVLAMNGSALAALFLAAAWMLLSGGATAVAFGAILAIRARSSAFPSSRSPSSRFREGAP